MANFTSDAHALRMGYLLGTLTKSGIHVELVYDDDDNYIDEFVVVLQVVEYDPPTRIRLKVLPPEG